MSHKFYVFSNAENSQVGLSHDSGWHGHGTPGLDPQGRSGYILDIPDSVPDSNGAQLNIDAPNKVGIQVRGLLKYIDDRAYLQVDDFYLQDTTSTPPIPPPVTSNEPEDIINEVYARGIYNLALKDDCGRFTEDCCAELHRRNNQTWGHIKKNPGQNQWNGHAVDAVQCLGGPENGIWDIIVSSVSTNAHPAYNRAGDAKPELWYYPPAPR